MCFNPLVEFVENLPYKQLLYNINENVLIYSTETTLI